MDIEFREKTMEYLREQAVEVLYQEETAELIVPDSYPDVQAIADSAAVCCLRDREVTAGSMTVSGAFQASILYRAEGDGEACSLDAYLPFSAKLNREDIETGSMGCAEVRIRSVDARVLNSRKLMVRVSYAVRMTAYGRAELQLWDAEPSAEVQLHRVRETGYFPVAMAEKQTTFSENIEIPAMNGEIRKIVKAVPELQLTEVKAVDSKAVLKGSVQLHTVYLLENGQLGCFDVQLPVSQYLEFEDDISEGTVRASGCLSEFQIEQDDVGGYLVTVGLQLQAVIWRQMELPLITDGYATRYHFEEAYESYRLREVLDELSMMKTAEGQLRGKLRKVVDCTAWVDFPVCRRSTDEITVTTSVSMHVLYYNDQEQLCGETVKTEESGSFALHDGAVCYADTDPVGNCYASMAGENTTVSCGISISARCFAEKQVRTMKSAAVGEPLSPEEDRPSLVVCRIGAGERIWDIAKRNRATVAAIREANGLAEDTIEDNSLLLIPMS